MEVVGLQRSYFINSELKERSMESMYCISQTIFLSCLGLFSFVFGHRILNKGIKIEILKIDKNEKMKLFNAHTLVFVLSPFCGFEFVAVVYKI